MSGFVGSHLAEACLARGWRVHGTIRSSRSPLDNLAGFVERLTLHRCDITDLTSVEDTVRLVRPDLLFHLAGQSFVPDSWTAPQQTIDANVKGTLNVLDAVRRHSAATTVQVASSSEVYGLVHKTELPITEDNPLRPLSPYGVSKAAADLLAQQYAASYGLRVVITRAFSHEGPRRGADFAPSDWCLQVARAEAGLQPPVVRHGNLEAVRDVLDVRDVVEGYLAAVARGKAGRVYQFASGEGRTMAEILDIITGQAQVTITPQMDTARLRPSDVPRLVGSYARANEELGWTPNRALATTLGDCLNYWRGRIGSRPLARRRKGR